MPNRLVYEKSPYLLQHSNQPVDWYPWGEEAFRRAREEGKPVFLSIGYSTCHWCHVMAHESFDDEEVADLLNRYFVSIKVDREERPDVDHVYMIFCQLMRGNCGWPLSVFMTPDKKPFFVGTYFPKRRRPGLDGFLDILEKIVYLWLNNRQEIEDTADSIFKIVQQSTEASGHSLKTFRQHPQPFQEEIFYRAYRNLERSFDPLWGGFGPPPKFPTPHQLRFLLRYYNRYGVEKALKMVERTLDGMASGGIYDQLGGGFHRYSVDREWIVPHFEKMLYDQALIPMAYLEAWQVTKNPAYEEIISQTLRYVLDELLSTDGGFYSAQDADIDCREGEYYLWDRSEIMSSLGTQAGNWACSYWGVEGKGNFEGRFVLYRAEDRRNDLRLSPLPDRIKPLREKLLAIRRSRPKPMRDDKILTSWNGLMIAFCARVGEAFKNPLYISASEKAANFLLANLVDPKDYRLYRCYREGTVTSEGFLEDYAFFIKGLLELYLTTFEPRFLRHAQELADRMISLFWDDKNKGFYFVPGHKKELPLRSKELFDGATPSGNSVAFEVLLLLDRVLSKGPYGEMASEMFDVFEDTLLQIPTAYTYFLCGLDVFCGPTLEITILQDAHSSYVEEVRDRLNRAFLPRTIYLVSEPDSEREKTEIRLCKGKTCMMPIDASVFLRYSFVEGDLRESKLLNIGVGL
ncbi:MAG: thioredoxin domain-containing protein [Syntrophobacterales bacterium]|nr:thioredoxin domain-containing protein [Syntrophobacterales bacterium]